VFEAGPFLAHAIKLIALTPRKLADRGFAVLAEKARGPGGQAVASIRIPQAWQPVGL
jgi:hypothetical protein